MKKYEISDLVQMYKDAESVDSEVFSEQRSNLLLVAGQHWSRKNSAFWNDRIRDNRSLSSEQKLRITKNHIYRVSKIRTNLLLTHAPGVRVIPSQEGDNQSVKAAQLNQSVWEFGKYQQNMKQKTQQFANDFFNIGEVAAKVWWNPDGGSFKGYEQAADELTGEPAFDEMGQPVADNAKPRFEGSLEIERIFAFNLLRDPNAKEMRTSEWVMIRKMVAVKDLKNMFDEEDERQKFITDHKDETYVIFDNNKQNYRKENGVTTLKECYIRPCPRYPMGYYYVFLDAGILFEGELPYGLFPIVYEGHDENVTTARHRSPIKQLRPYQIEINRAASAQAENSIVHGQDKMILQAGAKLTPGEILPGLRAYHATGRDPVILEGKTGEQWANYISTNISELYQAALLEEEALEKQADGEPWSQLFKSMKQKKKFVMDAEKFEGFLVRITQLYLDLARNYFPDDMLIPAIGKNEIVNISEFRSTTKLSYLIKAEPMSDDLESMFGKMLSINHILQYSSNQLEREDIGKMIRMLPFANEEKSFSDFTLNYDRAENTILALDRGESPEPLQSDDSPYMIKRLSARMAQPDFSFLHVQIQENYRSMITIYEELEATKAQKLKAMEADFVPVSGPHIKVAWYIKDPTNPSRSVQATLPAESINWLVQRISEQSGFKQENAALNSGSQANIAQMYMEKQGQQGQAQQSAPPAQEMPGMPSNKGFMQ